MRQCWGGISFSQSSASVSRKPKVAWNYFCHQRNWKWSDKIGIAFGKRGSRWEIFYFSGDLSEKIIELEGEFSSNVWWQRKWWSDGPSVPRKIHQRTLAFVNLQVFGQDSRIGNSEPWAIADSFSCGWCSVFFWKNDSTAGGFHQREMLGFFELDIHLQQGLVTVPFWEYWISPEKVAI